MSESELIDKKREDYVKRLLISSIHDVLVWSVLSFSFYASVVFIKSIPEESIQELELYFDDDANHVWWREYLGVNLYFNVVLRLLKLSNTTLDLIVGLFITTITSLLIIKQVMKGIRISIFGTTFTFRIE
jgi:hypothetical protein